MKRNLINVWQYCYYPKKCFAAIMDTGKYFVVLTRILTVILKYYGLTHPITMMNCRKLQRIRQFKIWDIKRALYKKYHLSRDLPSSIISNIWLCRIRIMDSGKYWCNLKRFLLCFWITYFLYNTLRAGSAWLLIYANLKVN